tara:strand:- start:32934 stop:35546 length:2613 start_codon:yes stop_codon:yes gene_type:complete
MLARAVCLLVVMAFSAGVHAEEKDLMRILVIYGSADLSPWIQSFNTALADGLGAGKSTRVQVEFLDISQYSAAENLEHARAIHSKIKKIPPDLVLGVLPDANNFVANHLSVIAPGAPVLYVLPGLQLQEKLSDENYRHIIGSYWEKASVETFELIRTIFPQASRLYYIVGTSPGNLSYLTRTRAVLDDLTGGLETEVLVGLTPGEVRARLESAPKNSVAIYITLDHDRFGNQYSGPEVMELIRNKRVPIFSMLDTVSGFGSIGGSYTSASLYGSKAADYILKMHAGLGVSAVGNALGTGLVFDDNLLVDFSVDRDLLPESAVLLNHETSLWQRYFLELLIGIVIIVLQTLLIVLLYAESRRRKLMERDRENQSRLFDSVINGISDAIVVANESGRVVATNSPGFESTFSQRPAQIQGQSILQLFGEQIDLDAPSSGILSCKRGSRFFPGETVLKPIVDIEGVNVGYFAVIRDVSERLANEEELRQAHKMEAVGNLAGGIAHDFNNILMAIIGNAEIALEMTESKGAQGTLLERILTAADRARDLVRQIMSFSRRDETDQKSAVHLKALLGESRALIETSFPSSIEAEVVVSNDLSFIEANPTQLQQIILNLCSNANHAMSGKGTIEISAQNTSFPSQQFLINSSMPAGNYVALKISDSGVGIDDAHLQHIFDPFFTTKGRGEGTGMGLAMVYRIVESHEGYIDLATSPEGSCFSIYFPAKEAVAVPEHIVPETSSLLAEGLRVLLVDDDQMVLKVAEGGLKQMGCVVTSFSDSSEALDTYRTHATRYDLLVTDQVMPGMDGAKLIEKVRAVREIPAILCTGNAEVSDLQGMRGVELLRKPYTQAQLRTLIVRSIQNDDDDDAPAPAVQAN